MLRYSSPLSRVPEPVKKMQVLPADDVGLSCITCKVLLGYPHEYNLQVLLIFPYQHSQVTQTSTTFRSSHCPHQDDMHASPVQYTYLTKFSKCYYNMLASPGCTSKSKMMVVAGRLNQNKHAGLTRLSIPGKKMQVLARCPHVYKMQVLAGCLHQNRIQITPG